MHGPDAADGLELANQATTVMTAGRHTRLRVRQLGEVAVAVPWFASAPLYRRWHLRWGATAQEVRGSMPGDELVSTAHFTATRAITIEAAPEAVWPWLVQVGVGRGGFYSYDLLDSRGAPSAHQVLPRWQHVEVGDLAAPMTTRPTAQTSFVVAAVRRPLYLVWAKPDSTWAWELTPLVDGRTRLVTRLKQRYPGNLSMLLTVPLMEFGDFPMMRKMLRGVRDRSERGDRSRQQFRSAREVWSSAPVVMPCRTRQARAVARGAQLGTGGEDMAQEPRRLVEGQVTRRPKVAPTSSRPIASTRRADSS